MNVDTRVKTNRCGKKLPTIALVVDDVFSPQVAASQARHQGLTVIEGEQRERRRGLRILEATV